MCQHHLCPSTPVGRLAVTLPLSLLGLHSPDHLLVSSAMIIMTLIMRSPHNFFYYDTTILEILDQNYDGFNHGVAYPGLVKESISWAFCVHSEAGPCPAGRCIVVSRYPSCMSALVATPFDRFKDTISSDTQSSLLSDKIAR